MASEAFSSQSFPNVLSFLLISPLSFLHSLCQNQRRRLLIWALWSPRSLRKPKSRDPSEESGETPPPVNISKFGAQNRRIIPVHVAWDLCGDEQLWVEWWWICGARQHVCQSLQFLFPCCVIHYWNFSQWRLWLKYESDEMMMIMEQTICIYKLCQIFWKIIFRPQNCRSVFFPFPLPVLRKLKGKFFYYLKSFHIPI